jgi:hypothetical protein
MENLLRVVRKREKVCQRLHTHTHTMYSILQYSFSHLHCVYFFFLGGCYKGIIGYGTTGLVISRTLGGLYFLDLTTTTTTTTTDTTSSLYQLASPQDAPFNGGLCLDGNLLYSTETTLNSISVWKLMTNDEHNTKTPVLSFLGRIASVDFDFPSSCAIYDDTIYTVNPRFDTLPFPANKEESLEYFQEVFYMIGVNRFDFD